MNTVKLTLAQIKEIAVRAFSQNGCDIPNTEALVRTVLNAERDGSLSHGLFRIPGYIASLRSKKVNGNARPRVHHRTPVILQVDGDNGYAPLALEYGVPALTAAAAEMGIAALAITRVHHFAALWHETEAIADRNLIGLACVCYKPTMAPAGGNRPLFGTNPISFSWPRPGRWPVVFDMATASRAMGDIQVAAQNGHVLPPGIGLDATGQPTTDPVEVLKGMLLPFGGYKGSLIALMVELMAAGAIGENFSYEAADADNNDGGPPRGGEFLMAISPELLAGPNWAEHCEKFFQQFELIDGARLPGTRRYTNRCSDEPRQVDSGLIERIMSLV